MTYKQLREILDYVRHVHRQAAVYCGDSANAGDERRRLLADFYEQREQALAGWLASLRNDEQTAVLDAWVQYVPNEGVDEALTALRRAQDQGSLATSKGCLRLQEEIIRLVRQLADTLNMPPVHDILLALAAGEEHALKQLALADATQGDV